MKNVVDALREILKTPDVLEQAAKIADLARDLEGPVTIAEYSRRAGIQPRTTRDRIKSGKIQAIPGPGKTMVCPKHLYDFTPAK